MNVTDVVIVWRVFFTRLSYFFTMEFETYTKYMKFEQGFWEQKGPCPFTVGTSCMGTYIVPLLPN